MRISVAIARLATVPFIFFAASCGSLQSNAERSVERRPQASDSLTGNSQLVVSALRSTSVAVVRQPVTTVRTGVAVMWNRPREVVSGNLPVEILLEDLPTQAPGTEAFEQLLDEKGMRPRENGKLDLLVDGKAFFGELDEQLSSAQKSVEMQLFIFDNDDIAVRYADRLKQLAEDLTVKVLYDDLGSAFAHTSAPETLGPRGFQPPANMYRYLKDGSKLKVRRSLNPWLVCDHTKLIVFDHRTAILGGMNMGREYYSEWHDLMVKVEGPVVGSLSREFGKAWKKAGPWGDYGFLAGTGRIQTPASVAGEFPVRLLRTDPARGTHQIVDATLLAIRAAKKRIWIQNPYFAHDETALALAAAARRGVDVRVILPAKGDSAIMDAGNMGTARGLIDAGAKLYRFPRMTHMKTMICDDWAQIGSANLDILSMRINRELNIAFTDRGVIRELERQVFLPDIRASERIRIEETTSPIAPIAESIADQL